MHEEGQIYVVIGRKHTEAKMMSKRYLNLIPKKYEVCTLKVFFSKDSKMLNRIMKVRTTVPINRSFYMLLDPFTHTLEPVKGLLGRFASGFVS